MFKELTGKFFELPGKLQELTENIPELPEKFLEVLLFILVGSISIADLAANGLFLGNVDFNSFKFIRNSVEKILFEKDHFRIGLAVRMISVGLLLACYRLFL